MNLCHGYLNALQLSTPELEELIHIARTNGVDAADIELLGAIARDGTRRLAERHAVTQRTVRNRRDAATGRIREALSIAA